MQELKSSFLRSSFQCRVLKQKHVATCIHPAAKFFMQKPKKQNTKNNLEINSLHSGLVYTTYAPSTLDDLLDYDDITNFFYTDERK